MRVGISMFNQVADSAHTDREVIQQELRLAVLAEELGFEFVQYPEHHFDSYSVAPDNCMLQAAVAAQTSSIGLLLGVVVLPWWTPVRAAERILLLDNISDGRVMLALGRGLARREYNAFGVSIEEARDRFTEAASMVLPALESGVIEGDGQYYHQERVELRPGPLKTFVGRTWGAAMSPPSAKTMAEIKAGLLGFITGPWEQHVAMYESYAQSFRDIHGEEPLPLIASDYTYCHHDSEVAEATIREYQAPSFRVERDHYELNSDDMAKGRIKGYESYAQAARTLQTTPEADLIEARVQALAHGTPDEIIEIYRRRTELLPAENLMVMLSPTYGGMPYDKVESSMRLLAAEVLPELKKMGAPSKVAA